MMTLKVKRNHMSKSRKYRSPEERDDNTNTEVIQSEEEPQVEVEDNSGEKKNDEVIESGSESDVEVENISSKKFKDNTTPEEVHK